MKIESALILGITLGLPAVAIAGPEATMKEAPASNSGDWCTWYGNKPGVLYKNSENPYIQEFQLEGRLQYQFGHVDGNNIAGGEWNENYDEVRRARLGVKMKFLQYFGMKYQINLATDDRPSGGDLHWGYEDIDEAYFSFNLAKAFENSGFDELSLVYGRQKFVFGTESHASSTKLLTIERSALANKVYGSFRPTGLTLEGVKGPLTFNASVYSSSTDGSSNEEFNGWQDSYAVLFGVGYQASKELLLRMDAVYNSANPSSGDDSFMNYAWAVGFGAEYNAGAWGVNADAIYGDNGGSDLQTNPNRRGAFYGFQVTPYYWLVDKKLQFVTQYQYQGSEESEGVRINSRYGRSIGSLAINSGRGDSHHSLYTGLNYYLCGQSAKIQAGIEYQTMDAPGGDFNTLTYLLGFRTYF